jgi:hypothetical protein
MQHDCAIFAPPRIAAHQITKRTQFQLRTISGIRPALSQNDFRFTTQPDATRIRDTSTPAPPPPENYETNPISTEPGPPPRRLRQPAPPQNPCDTMHQMQRHSPNFAVRLRPLLATAPCQITKRPNFRRPLTPKLRNEPNFAGSLSVSQFLRVPTPAPPPPENYETNPISTEPGPPLRKTPVTQCNQMQRHSPNFSAPTRPTLPPRHARLRNEPNSAHSIKNS